MVRDGRHKPWYCFIIFQKKIREELLLLVSALKFMISIWFWFSYKHLVLDMDLQFETPKDRRNRMLTEPNKLKLWSNSYPYFIWPSKDYGLFWILSTSKFYFSFEFDIKIWTSICILVTHWINFYLIVFLESVYLVTWKQFSEVLEEYNMLSEFSGVL